MIQTRKNQILIRREMLLVRKRSPLVILCFIIILTLRILFNYIHII
jgi:hypothetical protein